MRRQLSKARADLALTNTRAEGLQTQLRESEDRVHEHQRTIARYTGRSAMRELSKEQLEELREVHVRGVADTERHLQDIRQRETTCQICMNAPKNTVLTGCGHVFCLDCATRQLYSDQACYFCRQVPTGLQQLNF